MLRTIKRILLWTFAACASAALLFAGLIMWPDPLFAFSLGDGKIIIRSDRPIPDAGGNRLLHDCETLLARSPLPAEGLQYRIYGRLIHNGYVPPRPRTLAYYCGHELTHVVEVEHRFNHSHVPTWVWEGFADYVGIENRQSFEDLRDALGERPVDIPMRVRYGSYPRYRLLVTYFMEKKGWSVDHLFETRLTEDEANAVMRADGS
jgi:hypothetical protein